MDELNFNKLDEIASFHGKHGNETYTILGYGEMLYVNVTKTGGNQNLKASLPLSDLRIDWATYALVGVSGHWNTIVLSDNAAGSITKNYVQSDIICLNDFDPVSSTIYYKNGNPIFLPIRTNTDPNAQFFYESDLFIDSGNTLLQSGVTGATNTVVCTFYLKQIPKGY
jgi:hypothetical protein